MLFQPHMILSKYTELYDLIIPKDNILRRMKELVDFSFVYQEIYANYCHDNGRGAVDPMRLFKYLILKVLFCLSDVDVVERSRYDMSFKYFLDMSPEEDVINPSSLTKFRKLRLKNIELLDLLIDKTVQIAIENGVLKSTTLIVDATHTRSMYNNKTPQEALLEISKHLRKSVYKVDENAKNYFPCKSEMRTVEEILEYCKALMESIESRNGLIVHAEIREKVNLLKETIEDNAEKLLLSKDPDAKIGHKTVDSSFFGYKTSLAMTEERIITAAVVTTGEKHDGKALIELVEKSKKSGVTVDEVLGDTAYSEKDNLQYAKDEEFKLISKLHPLVSRGVRKKEDEFEFNKDAEMFVCKAGHMATRKAYHQCKKTGAKENPRMFYFFDVEKCKMCPFRDGCYKENSQSKVYSIALKSVVHVEQKKFQETDYFKQRSKQRYMIEAKNSELKNRHDYDRASMSGLLGLEMQGALTIFAVNLKRIIKLLG